MIRPLTPDDAEAFFAVRLRGLELHPEAYGTGADVWRKAPIEQVAAMLESGADPAARMVFGAFDGEELIGVVGFRREGRVAIRHKGSIWGFFVDPRHRRRGVGGDLLRTALGHAASCEGMQYVRAVVTITDPTALHTFESVGFDRYGLERGALRVGNTSHDQAYLRRGLSDGVR